MTPPTASVRPAPAIVVWLHLIGIAATTTAAGLALSSLWQWWFGDWRQLVYDDTVPMAPGTALLLILLSLAVGFLRRWAGKPSERIFAGAVAAVTTLVAVAVVVSSLIGVDLRWEQWLIRTNETVRGVPVGRMSPFTATAFLLTTVGLVVLLPPLRRRRWSARIGLGAVVCGGGFSLITALAYGSGTPLFYNQGIVPMAFTTAIAISGLNLSLLLTGWIEPILIKSDRPPSGIVVSAQEARFRRRLLAITVVLAGGLVYAGFQYLRNEQAAARATCLAELNAIANLKTDQIQLWREGYLREAHFLMRSTALAADVANLLARPADPVARDRLDGWLGNIRGGDHYQVALLFDARLHLLAGPPATVEPKAAMPGALLSHALQAREPIMGELHREAGAFLLDLAVPIPNADPASAPLAVLLLQINAEHFLFPMIQTWPVPSATAETLLIRPENDEVLFLNELRHRRGTALTLRHSIQETSLPAAKAARGELGNTEGLDYRGVPVLATTRSIRRSPWLLVAKIDQHEVYEPMQDEALRIAAFVGLLLLAVVAGATALARHRNGIYLQRLLAAEKEQAALAQRFAAVMQQASDCILLFEDGGVILDANQKALDTYGYTLDELRRLPPGGLRPPHARKNLPEQLRLFDNPDGARYETVHQRKDGSTFPVEVSTGLVLIDDRRIKLGINRDISARKEQEAQIERLNRYYAALSQVNSAIVHLHDRDSLFAEICRVLVAAGRFKLVWVGWLDSKTLAIQPVARHGDDDNYLQGFRLYADDRPENLSPVNRAIRDGRAYVCNDFRDDPAMSTWQARVDRHGFKASIALPVRQRGMIVGALSICSGEPGVFGEKEIALLQEAADDVSFALDLMESEAQLQASETRFRTLFENSLDGFLLTIPDGRILAANPAACRMLGRTEEEILQVGGYNLVDPADPRLATLLEQRNRTGRAVSELTFVRGDGTRLAAEVASVIFQTEAGPRASVVIRDITERKVAEARIREQAELLDKASEAIVVIDLDRRITYWNRGAERVFGYTVAEVVGKTIDQVPPLAAFDPKLILPPLAGGNDPWLGEVQSRNRQGALLVLDTSITLVRDDAGRPKAHLTISADVTETKQLQDQFMRAQRLESIGMLAAGIAHDLNNVLAPILMSAALIRDRLAAERDRQLLTTIEKSAERGARLVRQILGFAHGVGGGAKPMQAKHLLRDIVEVIEATYPKSIALEHEIPSDLWPVIANPTQIHQVLLNLCVNARDAMPDGGTLRLRAENRVLDQRAADAMPDARPGPWVVLEVADTGTGIPPEILPHLWEAFFTTKPVGKGTGLGLATVRGIVATHRGFVALHTEVGRGTTFQVYLPADESALEGSDSDHPFLPPRGNDELILVADDEQDIRDIAAGILTKFGYRVLTAIDGEDAFASFRARASEIALVVTDLDMPRLDGVGLARQIRQIDPAMKLLFISGVDRPSRAKEGMEEFAAPRMQKPFSAEELLTEIYRALHPESRDG